MAYKLEMHLHTAGNSVCAKVEPQAIAELYAAKGYDGVVVTNHFNRHIYNKYFEGGDKQDKLTRFFKAYREIEANPYGLDVFFGVEFALRDDHYHYATNMQCAELLVYGITPDEFIEYADKIIDMDYAEFKALADNKGWLVIQAHPYRTRTKLLPAEYVDGIEVYNANPRQRNRNYRARRLLRKRRSAFTAGSDFHQPQDVGAALVFDAKPSDVKDLADKIRKGAFTVEYTRKRKML